MTDRLVDVSLTEWEDGIDLILDTRVPLPPMQVWPHVTHSELVEAWFVAYSSGEHEDQIVLELDDQPVTAHVLSVEAPHSDEDTAHILLDIDGIGRLGLTLTPDPADAEEGSGRPGGTGRTDGTDPATADSGQIGTRIVLSHTIADPGVDHALLAQVIPQVGPVWETHLRLLAGTLTRSPGAYDVPEELLTDRYEQIVREFA